MMCPCNRTVSITEVTTTTSRSALLARMKELKDYLLIIFLSVLDNKVLMKMMANEGPPKHGSSTVWDGEKYQNCHQYNFSKNMFL
jgi:hypothetical protein